MKRRTFLKGIGGITVLVVGGGVWRAYDQGVFSVGQGHAYEPWKNWRTDANAGPLPLVRAAILAASPHNTQPWIFKVSETRIELYADTTCNLGAFDPYLREMYIGLGCALENMALAAVANGYKANIGLGSGHSNLLLNLQKEPLNTGISGLIGQFYPKNWPIKDNGVNSIEMCFRSPVYLPHHRIPALLEVQRYRHYLLSFSLWL